MNEWSIYIALYCVLLYTQSTLQSYEGVSLQPPPVYNNWLSVYWMNVSKISEGSRSQEYWFTYSEQPYNLEMKIWTLEGLLPFMMIFEV